MTVLPTYKKYTVDYRLREFRLMNYPDKSEFISFQSPQGFKMLQDYEAKYCPKCLNYPCSCEVKQRQTFIL